MTASFRLVSKKICIVRGLSATTFASWLARHIGVAFGEITINIPIYTPPIRTSDNCRMSHLTTPDNLPVPVDDGACDHLEQSAFPSLDLPTTAGAVVNLIQKPNALTVIFCYPRTGAVDEKIPDEWNAIPGARGCTPQACSFRDLLTELQAHGVEAVYGLSTQSTAYQQEVKERLHLPYDLISDEDLKFVKALNLPTFDWQGAKLVKRITLAVSAGKIVKKWYPVFPTHRSADEVLQWLKQSEA